MTLTMKDELLTCFLQANGEPISGQQLAERFHVSRTAIWKHMQTLQQEGYTFETVKKKGYRLVASADKIDKAQLASLLKTKRFGHIVHHFEETVSTQLIAHELVRDGAPDGTVVIAEAQTAGRGRMMREWDSAKGKGIWMTVIVRPAILPHQAPQFTLVTAVAVVNAIKKLYPQLAPAIKWPNDLLIGGKKSTGILTEMIAETDGVQALLIGIGINVNQQLAEFPDELQTIATSLAIELGEPANRVALVAEVLHFLEHYCDHYVKHGFGQLKTLWEEASTTIGKVIRATTVREVIEGTAVSITEHGVLRIRTSTGDIKEVYSADIELL